MSYCLSLKCYLLVARSRVLAGVRYYSLLSTTCFLTRYARLESRPGSAAVNVTAPGCGLRGPFADAGNLQPATCNLRPATCKGGASAARALGDPSLHRCAQRFWGSRTVLSGSPGRSEARRRVAHARAITPEGNSLEPRGVSHLACASRACSFSRPDARGGQVAFPGPRARFRGTLHNANPCRFHGLKP